MKRVLLALAFVAVALIANAQTQEVARAKGDGFGFLNKNLTTEGKVIPYSTIGGDYWQSYDKYPQEADFTIYDEAFNKVKSFSYPLNKFTYKRIPMIGYADIIQQTPIKGRGWSSREDWDIDSTKTFTTLDEFKQYILGHIATRSSDPYVFFIDYNGHFAFHATDSQWETYSGIYVDENYKQLPTVTQDYFYYNKEEKAIYHTNASMALEVDIANASFQEEEGAEGEEFTNHEFIEIPYLIDYDFECNEAAKATISQNVFNKDDKFEFIVCSYKLSSPPSDKNTDFENGLEAVGMENGKLKIRKQVEDNYYESYYKIVNEDGKELFSLPYSYVGKDASIFRFNGKTYMSGLRKMLTKRKVPMSSMLWTTQAPASQS